MNGPARVQLSIVTIVEAALHLARTQGLEALTMRSIGEHLHVHAMALYHYLPNKAVLQQLMVDQSLRQLRASILLEGPADNREKLQQAFAALHRAAADNPVLRAALPSSLHATAPVNDLTTTINPALLALLQDNTMSATHAEGTHLALLAVTAAFAAAPEALEEANRREFHYVIDQLLTAQG